MKKQRFWIILIVSIAILVAVYYSINGIDWVIGGVIITVVLGFLPFYPKNNTKQNDSIGMNYKEKSRLDAIFDNITPLHDDKHIIPRTFRYGNMLYKNRSINKDFEVETAYRSSKHYYLVIVNNTCSFIDYVKIESLNSNYKVVNPIEPVNKLFDKSEFTIQLEKIGKEDNIIELLIRWKNHNPGELVYPIIIEDSKDGLIRLSEDEWRELQVKKEEKAEIKEATVSIMSRGESHNLGSHAFLWLKRSKSNGGKSKKRN